MKSSLDLNWHLVLWSESMYIFYTIKTKSRSHFKGVFIKQCSESKNTKHVKKDIVQITYHSTKQTTIPPWTIENIGGTSNIRSQFLLSQVTQWTKIHGRKWEIKQLQNDEFSLPEARQPHWPWIMALVRACVWKSSSNTHEHCHHILINLVALLLHIQ